MVNKILLDQFLNAIDERKDFFLKSININNKKDLEKAEISEKITDFKKSVHIYSHLDSDGLTSAAILASALKRANISYQLSVLPQLETKYIENIKQEIISYNRFIIFSDFGTGQLRFLKKELEINNYLILDHHQPENLKEKPDIFHVNPYYYDISGESEISAAGVCYYFAKALDPKNIDLSSLAIIGALGDMQNKGDKGTFIGANKSILDDAIKTGKITLEKDLAINRRQPLHIALAYSLPEKLPAISGSEQNAKLFLNSLQIKMENEWNDRRTLLNLSTNERKTLLKALINEGGGGNLMTNFYNLSNFDPVSDAKEMSKLLNACGRLGFSSLGITSLMGDKESLLKAIEKNKIFKREISIAIRLAEENIRNYENINTFYHNDINEKIIGTICSILVHSKEELKNKPLIAFADSDDHSLKVSARADRELVKKGLNLGKILREVCQKMDIINPAGGHPPAAGAKIKSMNLKTFIEEVDKAVGKKD